MKKQKPDFSDAIRQAREVLEIEVQAISALMDRLDENFGRAVALILECQGRVVVTGIGKSGSIGRKISATLASTGTPSLFLHPAEGVHGDLGMVAADDVLVALSYSGDTEEIITIIPAIKRIEVPIIALTGNLDSPLAKSSEVVLDVSVEKEACPLGLAPTASTTTMLALGDALAVAVMRARRFSREDFALLHPAGSLGRRLLLTAQDLMRTDESLATVTEETILKDVLFAITKANAGAANVVSSEGILLGIITDGDIRRSLLKDEANLHRPVGGLMIRDPKTIKPDQLATEALRVMELHKIAEMPVIDEQGRPLGVLNLKDLLKAGIV